MNIIFPNFKPFCTKVLFYRIPKNASTSIHINLAETSVISSFSEELSKKADKKLYKGFFDETHVKPDELLDLVSVENIQNLFSFCVVRDPWERAVSMFCFVKKFKLKELYKINAPLNFSSFCSYLKDHKDDKYFIGSHKQVEWIKGKYPPKRIIRFENLKKEFKEMVEEINLVGVNPNLPKLNTTKHTHYSDYYNSDNKKIISEVFEEDIDTFNYTFKGADPGYQESTGSKGSLRI